MNLRINPFDAGNPMSMKDAATVAAIAAFVVWILSFLANASYGVVAADPEAFLFESVKIYAVAWAGNFITLAGLEAIVKKSAEESAEPG